ncbi:lantibiotic dehydratase [Actinacidiphila sp. DG2A-62]|uniref:lantibiotic dehydratase n=1 Tax=Actinacidiphila sp. DG2A-62 TaxID=3108821 RepID=UPI002DB5B57C|nr:lantibiotic dehydratase [Actinacidiphila sp. DG2A-62]MEC3997219.1 lantibiotic dehydratase [Actinacidiphila sp. DG2A-62]
MRRAPASAPSDVLTSSAGRPPSGARPAARSCGGLVSHKRFQAADGALIRAVGIGAAANVPDWPAPTGSGTEAVTAWTSWMRQVLQHGVLRDALEHAAPDLVLRISALADARVPDERDSRRAAVSVARYVARLRGRATPFGLFAGVTPAAFKDRARARWGEQHLAVAAADAGWLDAVITPLETDPCTLPHLAVVASTTAVVRDDRLVVPYRALRTAIGTGAAEVSLRHIAPVRAALQMSRSPIVVADLIEKLHADFPDASAQQITTLVTSLVEQGALLTNLRAPSTTPDALGHLLRVLSAVPDAAGLPYGELAQIHELLVRHVAASPAAARVIRSDAAQRMRRLAPSDRHPVAVDLRLDGVIELPGAVAREAERAVRLLARLSPAPYGPAAWQEWHRRFYGRYGTGALVPLLDVVADSGIGWPAGYPDAADAEPQPSNRRRDAVLLALAQRAALEGDIEVLLTEELIADLERTEHGENRWPDHLEIVAHVGAPSLAALEGGRFRLTATSVSRGVGVVTGRFLHLMSPAERVSLVGDIVHARNGSTPAQLSFTPLDPRTAHVARSTRMLPSVISIGEHRDPAEPGVLTPQDLAIGCDPDRLYLAAPQHGLVLEPAVFHALNLHTHTPPLARLVSEITRGKTAGVSDFDWGAASGLPFLPRIRQGRVVLAPARWHLEAADLPGRAAPWPTWEEQLRRVQIRRRIPGRVLLLQSDFRLPLDLDSAAGRALLREHLNTHPRAVLVEAPPPDADGWCGGRAHEVVIPLTSATPTTPTVPRPAPERVVTPTVSQLPGRGRLLLADFFGDRKRQNAVLAHLPRLLAELEAERWWFLRFRHEDAGDCIRLRIALRDPAAFGPAASRVGAWADGLRHAGLLRDLTFATDHEQTGRWGAGPALDAAEGAAAADSRAVLTQLAAPSPLPAEAVTAANFVSIVAAFTGSPQAAVRWLISHVPPTPPGRRPRPVHAAAVEAADPRDDFAALLAVAGGETIRSSWTERTKALAAYAAHWPSPSTAGVDRDAALNSLLHTHYLRAHGVDPAGKRRVLHLARAAGLAAAARTGVRP